jgi:hypothetical protein
MMPNTPCTLLQLTFIKWFVGLKDQACLYRTFRQAVSQAATPAAIFNNWQWKKAS